MRKKDLASQATDETVCPTIAHRHALWVGFALYNPVTLSQARDPGNRAATESRKPSFQPPLERSGDPQISPTRPIWRIELNIDGLPGSGPNGLERHLLDAESLFHQSLQTGLVENVEREFFVWKHRERGSFRVGNEFRRLFDRQVRILTEH